MERRRLYASVGLAALFLAGCEDATSPIQPAPSSIAQTRQYAVSGGVRDTALRPLADARVEVVDGPRAGTVATTDKEGRFSMPGTFTGTITVVATKDGYMSDTKRVPPPLPLDRLPPPRDGELWESAFSLEPLGPSANIAGEYTLTLTAASACTGLPDEARRRTYAATITPISRTRFRAWLGNARFFSTVPCPTGRIPESCTYNQFWIGIAGDFAAIFVGIIEQLRETYLVISAGSDASFGSTGIEAPFNGSFLYCPREPYLIDQGTWACPANAGVECESDNHQLRLVRR